jgi:ribonuclease E
MTEFDQESPVAGASPAQTEPAAEPKKKAASTRRKTQPKTEDATPESTAKADSKAASEASEKKPRTTRRKTAVRKTADAAQAQPEQAPEQAPAQAAGQAAEAAEAGREPESRPAPRRAAPRARQPKAAKQPARTRTLRKSAKAVQESTLDNTLDSPQESLQESILGDVQEAVQTPPEAAGQPPRQAEDFPEFQSEPFQSNLSQSESSRNEPFQGQPRTESPAGAGFGQDSPASPAPFASPVDMRFADPFAGQDAGQEAPNWRSWNGWNDEDERETEVEQIQPARSRGRKKTASPKAPRQKAVRTDAEAAGVAEAPQAQAESRDFFVDGFFDVLQTVNEEQGEAEPGEGAPDGAPEEVAQKKRKRGRRGGRGHGRKAVAEQKPEDEPADVPEGEEPAPAARAGKSAPAEAEASKRPAGKRRMYISILPGEQVEVAITNNGILEEYYLDMLHQKKIKGNIYRGVIHNIDSNLQAAFIDFGEEKNGFLQIDEIHPEYYGAHHEATRGKKFPPIQKVLHIGQEVLVQVVKEPNGAKGAFLTTWISLAGRFLVLTPGQEQIGISRKVDDEEERSRLRELMHGIDPGDDLGVIVRTVSAGVTQTTLKNDLTYLKRTWSEVRKRATEVSAPACVYREPSLPERAVRDYLTDDVCEVWVDNAEIAERIRDTVALLFPQKKELVRLHSDVRHSMWERFNLRRQLDQIYSREVLMPSGGRLVFDQTEALMAIDINSGKISGKGNFEAMAFKTNMEAAETIARQLKLRDIGGQVVIDFIEMKEHKHIAEVERTLRAAMKNDRARHDVARMSSFGLLELVRQRTGTSALSISMEPCPACGGTGLRRNLEWQSLQALRDISRLLRSRAASPCQYEMPQELGLYLLNHKRDSLKELEQQFDKTIEIVIKA